MSPLRDPRSVGRRGGWTHQSIAQLRYRTDDGALVTLTPATSLGAIVSSPMVPLDRLVA